MEASKFPVGTVFTLDGNKTGTVERTFKVGTEDWIQVAWIGGKTSPIRLNDVKDKNVFFAPKLVVKGK